MFGSFLNTVSLFLVVLVAWCYNQSISLLNNNTICFQNYDKKSVFDKFLLNSRLLSGLTKFSSLNFHFGSGYIRISFDKDHMNEHLLSSQESSNFQIPVFVVKTCSEDGSGAGYSDKLGSIVEFYKDYNSRTQYECANQSLGDIDKSTRQICNVFNEEDFIKFAEEHQLVYKLMNLQSEELVFDIDGFNSYCVFSKLIHSKDFEYHLDENMPNKSTIPVKIISEIHSSLGNLKIFDFLNNIIISELFVVILFIFVSFFLCVFVAKLVFGQTAYFWNILSTYSTSYIPVVFVQLYMIYFDIYLLNFVHFMVKNNFPGLEMEYFLTSPWKRQMLALLTKVSDHLMFFLKISMNNFIEVLLGALFAKGYGFWINNENMELFKLNGSGLAKMMCPFKVLAFMCLNCLEFALNASINESNGPLLEKLRIYVNIIKETALLFVILSSYFSYVDFKRLAHIIEYILYSKSQLFGPLEKLGESKTKLSERLFELNLKLYIKKTLRRYNKTIFLLLVKLFFQVSLNFIELGFVDTYQASDETMTKLGLGQNQGYLGGILRVLDLYDFINGIFMNSLTNEAISQAGSSVIILNRKFEEERIIFFIHCLKNGVNFFINFSICLININFAGTLELSQGD